MPITFESPQPFSEQVSQGYGAAEQGARDLPTLASLYEAGARLTAQTNQANADRQFQAANAQANRNLQAGLAHAQAGNQGALQANQERTQVGLAQMQLNARADEFNAQAQQQANLLRQRFAQQQDLQNQELTQAERLRVQQLQAQKAAIQSEVDSGALHPEEGAVLMHYADAGLAPLQARAARSAVMQREQLNRQMLEQAQQQAALLSANEAVRTQAFNSRLYTDVDEETGERTKFFLNSKGDMVPLKPPKGEGADRSAQNADKIAATAQKEWLTANHQARQELAAMRREMDKDAEGKSSPRHPELQDPDVFEAKVFALTGKKLGYERPGDKMPGVDEHVMIRQGKPTGRTDVGPGQGLRSQNLAPEPRQPGVSPQAEQMSWKPFKADDRETQNDQQRLYVERTEAEIREFRDRPDLTKSVREGAVTAVQQARKLMEKYGSIERMRAESPTDFEAFQLMAQFIKALPPAPPPPPARGPRKGTLEHFTVPSLSS